MFVRLHRVGAIEWVVQLAFNEVLNRGGLQKSTICGIERACGLCSCAGFFRVQEFGGDGDLRAAPVIAVGEGHSVRRTGGSGPHLPVEACF